MVCKDNLALSTPDKRGFKFFTRKSIPLWSPPSRGKLTRMLEAKYDLLFNRVKNTLSKLPSLCLTADCWTETHSTSSYLGVTAHYLLEEEMESTVLGVKLMTSSHTGKYLGEKMEEVCTTWGIGREKVTLAVTDNASNMKLAAELTFGSEKRIGCFDHTLNLIPKDALGCRTVNGASVPNVVGVPPLIKKIKDVVTFSHSSYNFSNEIKRLQLERGKSEGTCKRLLQDCVTRWGSTFLMAERFLELAEVVTIACLKFLNVNMLSGAELSTVRAIKDLLHPFHCATVEMSAESTTTASKVIRVVHLLKKKIRELVIPENDETAQRFQGFLLAQLNERFKDVVNILPLAKATLLDPRFLKLYFSDSDQTALNAAIQSLVEDIQEEIRLECSIASDGVPTSSSVEGDDHNYASVIPDPSDLWSAHDAVVAAHSEIMPDNMTIAERARTELQAFLGRLPAQRTANPFKIWNGIKSEYPHLYKIAMRYLPLVCTSAPCERLFAGAGLIVDDQGSRLTSEHLSQRVFMASITEELWTSIGQ